MKKHILSFLLLASVFIQAQVSTFSFNINGSVPAGFAQALTIAGQRWSNYLQIMVPVKVNVFTVNASFLPFSAITLANGRKNFTNAPHPNILYTTALANQLAGTETNNGEYDMDIYFNLASSFYFGTGAPSSSSLDFITTAMHEIGHGLGFYSDGYVDASGNGSFGNIPPSALFPLTASFPWRGQDSVPSIYDTYIVKASGNHVLNGTPAYSAALGDSIKNGALYFSGPVFANASHSNTPVRLSGGAGTFSLGVDLLHIHNTYANTIMSYYWGAGDTVRMPAPWELGILKEIGWNMKLVGLKEYSNYPDVVYYPNPADAYMTISAASVKQVELYTVTGELIQTTTNLLEEGETKIATQNLKEGIYFFRVTYSKSNSVVTKKMIVQH